MKWELRCDWAIGGLLYTIRSKNIFSLDPWRNEKYPILGAKFPIGIERGASVLFGIIVRGVHLNIYTKTKEGIKIWLARRNLKKGSFPGKLDNAVAGGVALGEEPLSALLRETEEETGLLEEFVRDHVQAAGTTSWIYTHEQRGDPAFVMPGISCVYDLELDSEIMLKPVDGDIHEFILVGVNDVKEMMLRGEFKPMCANVMVDFLVRHGVVTKENEERFDEVVERLHRKMPFPVKAEE